MHEFEEQDCAFCQAPETAINLDGCLICETFQGACSECLAKHRSQHTAADFEAFRSEMLDEPQLTTRERINLELKEQIRKQAETLCKLIDDQESLVKKYENQCRVLAAELDRRTPAS